MPHTAADIREVIVGTKEPAVTLQFLEGYSDQCEEFVSYMEAAFENFSRIDKKFSGSEYGGFLAAITYAALNNHILALRMLLLGCLVPAGNLQRHVLEAIALALLGSDRELPMFQSFIDGTYSSSKALGHVIRHHDRLLLNKDALERLKAGAKHYDQYSHPTVMTVACSVNAGGARPNVALGGNFDRSMTKIYQHEISLRVSLARLFENLLYGIDRNASAWSA